MLRYVQTDQQLREGGLAAPVTARDENQLAGPQAQVDWSKCEFLFLISRR